MPREPEIVVFACNWCGYNAADDAGSTREVYPSCVRVIRVMCMGMVQPHMIMRAFEKGADGVYLMGCHMGDCHYVSGNEEAAKMLVRYQSIVQTLGLGRERLQMGASSAGEGRLFAQLLTRFVDDVGKLPPNPMKEA
jgi:F420-non-reducing hydrogenase iron-sulfur subunit